MSYQSFARLVSRGRSAETLKGFTSAIKDEKEFVFMVSHVMEVTTRWAEAVGLLETKKVAKDELSAEDKVWKQFFSDHQFPDNQTAKAFADLAEIITGKSMGRFLRTSRNARQASFFDRWVCVAPTDNPNSHSYKIGLPVLMWTENRGFPASGSLGNNMPTEKGALRLATKPEVESLLLSILYRSGEVGSIMMDDMLSGLPEDENEEE